ncbi:MAG: GNAT family N-acetyltransferase [Flammeovirgaceae bacterium]
MIQTTLPKGLSVEKKQLSLPEDQPFYEKIIALRQFAWAYHQEHLVQDKPKTAWYDQYDRNAYFTGIMQQQELIGIARMTLHDTIIGIPGGPIYHSHGDEFPTPIAYFCKLCIHPAFRGQKLGQFILEQQMAWAKQLGANSIALDCTEERVPFHERMGFKKVGEPDPSRTFPTISCQPLVYRFDESTF